MAVMTPKTGWGEVKALRRSIFEQTSGSRTPTTSQGFSRSRIALVDTDESAQEIQDLTLAAATA